jgi:cell division protein FtsW (lipid II flippase)
MTTTKSQEYPEYVKKPAAKTDFIETYLPTKQGKAMRIALVILFLLIIIFICLAIYMVFKKSFTKLLCKGNPFCVVLNTVQDQINSKVK